MPAPATSTHTVPRATQPCGRANELRPPPRNLEKSVVGILPTRGCGALPHYLAVQRRTSARHSRGVIVFARACDVHAHGTARDTAVRACKRAQTPPEKSREICGRNSSDKGLWRVTSRGCGACASQPRGNCVCPRLRRPRTRYRARHSRAGVQTSSDPPREISRNLW